MTVGPTSCGPVEGRKTLLAASLNSKKYEWLPSASAMEKVRMDRSQ